MNCARAASASAATGDEFVLGKQQTELGAHARARRARPIPTSPSSSSTRSARRSIDSNRVAGAVLADRARARRELWTDDTTNELRIAIGRTGATKLQYLAIGKGTRQHALFAGKTGSGKSTLFHVIITNLALACSPEQVEFYLIDFKKGVEFKCYADEASAARESRGHRERPRIRASACSSASMTN